MEQKNWISTEEAAEQLGVTVAHVRELCNIGKINKEKGLVASKVGKEWKILRSEINRKLGIKTDAQALQKELYIKELEGKIREYELKFNTMENLLKSVSSVLSS